MVKGPDAQGMRAGALQDPRAYRHGCPMGLFCHHRDNGTARKAARRRRVKPAHRDF